jgi:trimethylamine-N-oxide reductase (cytochrome c)
LCGVASRIIKALAREWASGVTSIAHGQGGNFARGPYSTEPARLEVILLGMQGLGKAGVQQAKITDWSFMGKTDELSLPRGVFLPNLRATNTGGALDDRAKQFIPKNMLQDAILNPPISWYGGQLLFSPPEDQFKKFRYPEKGRSEIHMVWADSPCLTACWNDGNGLIKAFQDSKIEFILTQHPWMEDDCLLSDVILPVNTKFEEEDIGSDVTSGQYQMVEYEEQCIEPLGESKSDYEIVCMIADRLGLLEEYTGGKSVEEMIKRGFDTSGAADYISFEEWKKNKYYVVPIDPKWQDYPPLLRAFHDDPENNPLETPSGKLEFYSQKLAECFPNDEERPPLPKWIPYGESHQESLLCERAKIYPLLAMSNHARFRVHAQHDDITWLREIPTCKIKGPDGYHYEPLWIHPKDAEERGIKDGDIVRIYNERGAVLGGALVTERIMPGAVNQNHGARLDPIVIGAFDRAGGNNTISPYNRLSKNATGMVVSGFLVEVERVDLDKLMRKYPDAFKRPFHHSAGPSVESFLYG